MTQQQAQIKSEFLNSLIIPVLFALNIFVTQVLSHSSGDSLFKDFQNPPESARPRTWWHWTGGNVTLDGITKDLEWMQRVGMAGFQLADVSFGSGQTVDDKILFGTDWPLFTPILSLKKWVRGIKKMKVPPPLQLMGLPEFTEDEKNKILGENARKLLGL